MFNNYPTSPYANMYMTPQQQLNQLVAQHPEYFNQATQQALQNQQVPVQQTPSRYYVVPVANQEEANATSVDLTGTPMFFYNKAKGEIYVKTFDVQTATATMEQFNKITPEESMNTENNLSQTLEHIKEQLNELYILKDKIDLVVDSLTTPEDKKVGKNAK